MDIGVFIPIGSNEWLISETPPQYKPSFALVVIAGKTDELAQAKWRRSRDRAGIDALRWTPAQGGKDGAAGDNAAAKHVNRRDCAVNFNEAPCRSAARPRCVALARFEGHPA